jgi:short-subunit dehydrogenase
MEHEHYRKLAVITGASSDIGFELARIFAKNDYDLVICSESAQLDEKAKILRQYEIEVTDVMADLSTLEGVEQLYHQINALNRPLDVVVINTGMGVGGQFVDTDWQDELNMINFNVVNLVHLTKYVLRDMMKFNEGKILFTSSLPNGMPGPYYAVYAATKAFVQSFTDAIRYEVKQTGRNITITSLQPSAIEKKDDPKVVAEKGYEALMSGKDRVNAGSLLKKIQPNV